MLTIPDMAGVAPTRCVNPERRKIAGGGRGLYSVPRQPAAAAAWASPQGAFRRRISGLSADQPLPEFGRRAEPWASRGDECCVSGCRAERLVRVATSAAASQLKGGRSG